MMFSLLRLTRPHDTVPLSGGLIVIVAYVTGGDLSGTGTTLIFAVLSLYCVLSAGYVLNDVCDIRYDRVNSPQRPIPGNRITKHAALIGAMVLFSTGIGLATLCGLDFFILLVFAAAGLVFYDIYSKRWGLFKAILVALLTTSLYPMAFALAEPVVTPRLQVLYIHPAWLFLTTLGYEMLKDIRDVKGDALAVVPHRGSLYARPAALQWARAILSAASLLTLLPYALGYCREVYLVSALTAIGLAAATLRLPPVRAIPCIYASVFVITAGSLADLWVYGP